MLWKSIYIGSEMVRSAMEDFFGTWPIGNSKNSGKIVLKKLCRHSRETNTRRRAHTKRKANTENSLEWKRQGEWEIF